MDFIKSKLGRKKKDGQEELVKTLAKEYEHSKKKKGKEERRKHKKEEKGKSSGGRDTAEEVKQAPGGQVVVPGSMVEELEIIDFPPAMEWMWQVERFNDIEDEIKYSKWIEIISMEDYLVADGAKKDMLYQDLIKTAIQRKQHQRNEDRLSFQLKEGDESSSEEEKTATTRDSGSSQSFEKIKNFIKRSPPVEKLEFTQGLLSFANKIEKRFLIEGLLPALPLLVSLLVSWRSQPKDTKSALPSSTSSSR